MPNNLTGKYKAFCRWNLNCGNVREAALRAGCSPETAEDEGLGMLQSSACRRRLGQLAAQPALPVQSLVTAGLSRLAFGTANDAAVLVFSDEPLSRAQLANLDLFHVVSMKRDKGSIEIKLADRQRAMEKLLECAYACESAEAAQALLSAISAPCREEVQHEPAGENGSLFPEAEKGSELVE